MNKTLREVIRESGCERLDRDMVYNAVEKYLKERDALLIKKVEEMKAESEKYPMNIKERGTTSVAILYNQGYKQACDDFISLIKNHE